MLTRTLIKGLLLLAFIPGAMAQCPSCDERPGLDCKVNFDNNSIYLRSSKQIACQANVVASYGDSRVNTCRRTFGSPFVLIDHEVVDHSSNNGWRSVSRYASGANVNYSEEIKEAYDKAIELAGQYGDTKAEARLREMKTRHMKIALQYSTNQDSLELKVEAEGHGWALDRKRGWQDSTVYANVACLAPVNLYEQLQEHAGLKGDSITIRNDSGMPFYMTYALTGDSGESCAAATPLITVRLNVSQSESLRLPINNGRPGKMCAHYYTKAPDKPTLVNGCEYSPSNNPVRLQALPAQCSN